MDRYNLTMGISCKEAEQLRKARLSTNPPSKDVKKPTFPFGVDQRPNYPEHHGWNPVYWSDYPKQPMWTVPLPKIPAPIVSTKQPVVVYRTRNRTDRSLRLPIWLPDRQSWRPNFNPYVDERNTPFKHLLGPPVLPSVGWPEVMYCP